MMIAQAKVMNLCHEIVTDGKIAPAPNISVVYPESCKPEDVLAAQTYTSIKSWMYLDTPVFGRYNTTVSAFLEKIGCTPTIEPGDMEIIASAKPDFIAISYYSSYTVAQSCDDTIYKGADQEIVIGEPGFYKGVKNKYLPTTEFGWQTDPVGLRTTLRMVYDRYHLPIIITENGLGVHDELDENGEVHDQYRIDFLRENIKQLKLAIEDGVDVFGYCPWSAIDIISTHQGFGKRYGFIYVNRDEFDLKDLKRYKKDSFYWYQKVIETNGEEL